MADPTARELWARLRFAVDQSDMEKSKKALADYDAAMKKIKESTDEATKRLQKMREQSERLQQVGMQLGVAGAAILAPFLLAARTYTQQVGQSEEASRRWTAANEKLQDAQIRIGRETTKILTPLLEAGADLADKFATFIEDNPDVLKAILTVGGGLAAAGTVVTLIAQAQKLITTVQLLTAAKTVGGLPGLPAGGAILATLTPLLPAIIAAVAAYLALNAIKLPGQDKSIWASAGDTLGKTATTYAFAAGSIFGPETAAKWGKAIGELTGMIRRADDATGKATDALGGFSEGQLKAYLSYLKADQAAKVQLDQQKADLVSNANDAELAAQQQFLDQKSEMIRSEQESELRDTQDFNRKRSQELRDFAQSDSKDLADYYANRLTEMRDHNKEDRRAEEDHQREIRNLQEDSQARLLDLTASRDALGMVREMRSAERERRRSEEAYRVEVRRKDEDLAQNLADQDGRFHLERERRIAQFAQQIADEDGQREIETQRRKADFDEKLQQMADQRVAESQRARADLTKKLNELDAQFKTERNQRRQAFYTQLQETASALEQERTLRAQFTAAMLEDLRQAVRAANSGNAVTIPSRDVGGYLSNGIFRGHKHEFVMTDRTTGIVEKLAGGTLDQAKVLSLLAGAAGGRGQLQYIDQRRIDSRLSSEDRRSINQDTMQTLGELVHGLV